MVLRCLLAGILVLVLSGVFAQDKFSDNLRIMVNYHYGFTLPEYTFVSHVANDNVQGFEVALMKERYGRDEFEQAYGYPENGVSLFFTSLGNNDALGQAVAVNYLFRLHFVSRPHFRVFNRMGIGLGYLTKTHHLTQNPMNVAIGSRLNIHYNCRLGMIYILDRLAFNGGVTFDHFSNGNTAEPNIGLNYVSFYLGSNFRIGDKVERVQHELEKHKKTFYGEVIYSIGGKHTRAFTSDYYVTPSLAGEAGFSVRRGIHLGAGVDVFYDSSIKTQLEDLDKEYKPHDSFQTGIHLSQTIAYRKFRFTLQEGFYLGLTDPINRKPLYNRGILKYYVNDNWSVRIAMKSHLHILDYPEIGVGYIFK